MITYDACYNCKHNMCSDDMGCCCECECEDKLTEDELDELVDHGEVLYCMWFERVKTPITPSDVNLNDTLILAAQKGLKSNNLLKQLYADYIHEEEPLLVR